MSRSIVVVHALLAFALTLGALACAWRPDASRTRLVARLTALAAVATAAIGIARIRVFEPTTRRATYFASHAAGAMLDRKIHFGLAACAFALALGVSSIAHTPHPRVKRLLGALAFAFACAAWLAVIYVRARAPAALLE